MKEYFKLQFKILNRKMNAFGIPSILGFPLVIIAFYGISFYVFFKTEYAAYLYGVAALSFVAKLGEQQRNYFLKTIFSVIDYRKLRVTENLIIIFPFVLFLIFKQSFLIALSLPILSIMLSAFSFNNSLNYTIPTPFSKTPFEFPIGFRKTYYFFLIAYFLTFQSIYVENFNLGVFSILLIVMVVLSYYSKPENEYYVWSFSRSSKGFLISKVKTGLLYFTILSLPTIISLMMFFPKEWMILMLFLVLSYVFIVTIIFAKYSAYPHEMSLPQGILLGISLMFPPVLLGVIPFFYTQSVKRLKPILEHD